MFAIQRTQHIAITPSETEICLIREYATNNDIVLEDVKFVPEPSELYLPRLCDEVNLDLILLRRKSAISSRLILLYNITLNLAVQELCRLKRDYILNIPQFGLRVKVGVTREPPRSSDPR